MWKKGVLDDLLHRAEDELDLPHKSTTTGFVNENLVRSFYKQMIQRNRCNRNDY